MLRMNRKIKGIGGVFFITVAVLCAATMTFVIAISRASTVEAISDNIAHIVATKVAVGSYITGVDPFDKYGNPSVDSGNTANPQYSPLEDFTKMAGDYGIIVYPPTTCSVSWDPIKKVATVQIGSFGTDFGETVKPHVQSAVIEGN